MPLCRSRCVPSQRGEPSRIVSLDRPEDRLVLPGGPLHRARDALGLLPGRRQQIPRQHRGPGGRSVTAGARRSRDGSRDRPIRGDLTIHGLVEALVCAGDLGHRHMARARRGTACRLHLQQLPEVVPVPSIAGRSSRAEIISGWRASSELIPTTTAPRPGRTSRMRIVTSDWIASRTAPRPTPNCSIRPRSVGNRSPGLDPTGSDLVDELIRDELAEVASTGELHPLTLVALRVSCQSY